MTARLWFGFFQVIGPLPAPAPSKMALVLLVGTWESLAGLDAAEVLGSGAAGWSWVRLLRTACLLRRRRRSCVPVTDEYHVVIAEPQLAVVTWGSG